ncbi:fumarylacetoacetate hydrolase family protein [Roseitranquillus sediminis]|uniref:fumarylacetoacetate hydrolase family protein n=1 Tax=Roseitranquillus sediminis TaxID=2809051 RepID=UPI001D0C5399|nr:fumarylacetoacetate hydrolase family protein [Roseitranquillus sediminis]MBM9595408.1 fumarylacetoacetate hydrolase family protein [Roseitranquillus sediminis]
MKLLRYGEAGREAPGMIGPEGEIRDLSRHVADLTPGTVSAEALDRLRDLDAASLPRIESDVRLGACIGGIGKIVCVGLNYTDHADESGMPHPKEPILFMKATSAVSGPNDPIRIPRGAEKTDWEVELGVIIGREARYVPEEDALDHVAGYCVANDVSERSFQIERGGQWVKGKSADTFGPLGPWLVTRDEVADPNDLALWLEVDGRRYQSGQTAKMIFSVPFLISYISRFMSLQAGDVILTGTPAGVGMGQTPPVYLRPGQRVTLEVDGLGQQSQMVEAAE